VTNNSAIINVTTVGSGRQKNVKFLFLVFSLSDQDHIILLIHPIHFIPDESHMLSIGENIAILIFDNYFFNYFCLCNFPEIDKKHIQAVG